jgi:hypothetical protein
MFWVKFFLDIFFNILVPLILEIVDEFYSRTLKIEPEPFSNYFIQFLVDFGLIDIEVYQVLRPVFKNQVSLLQLA